MEKNHEKRLISIQEITFVVAIPRCRAIRRELVIGDDDILYL